MKLILVPTLHPKLTLWVSAAGLMTARQGADASGSDTLAMPPCCVRVFGSGGYRRRAIGCEIVAPQSDGEGDDGEPGYNDCPRLGTKPLGADQRPALGLADAGSVIGQATADARLDAVELGDPPQRPSRRRARPLAARRSAD